eukprot:5919192-Pleurochrysis_carterae.AAC.2
MAVSSTGSGAKTRCKKRCIKTPQPRREALAECDAAMRVLPPLARRKGCRRSSCDARPTSARTVMRWTA